MTVLQTTEGSFALQRDFGSLAPTRVQNCYSQRRLREDRRLRPTCCFKVTASLTVDRLPLSSYKFPQLSNGSAQPSPLELAVKEAVLHLDQAPFLQLQRGHQTSQHPVDESIVHNSQLWKTFSSYLSDKDVEMVMLVHPLGAPESEKPVPSANNSEAVLTGITAAASAMHQRRLLSVAELVRSGATTADFSGQVGDCCEEEQHVSQVVAFRRASQHATHQGHTHSAHKGMDAARYWGVILQSKQEKEKGGCFVLKTLEATAGDDCHCISWSLTRVCNGAAILDQLNSAWLV